jgi:hypothetical protein
MPSVRRNHFHTRGPGLAPAAAAPSNPLPAVAMAALLLTMALLCACGRPHVQRIGNAQFVPRTRTAPVEVLENTLNRAYEPVALVDSNQYRADDPTSKTAMTEDLRKRARKVGADAVHKVRILEVSKRGAVHDPLVPIPGAWVQGTYTEHFMRGEAVRYIK